MDYGTRTCLYLYGGFDDAIIFGFAYRAGHLEQLNHMFKYLKIRHNTEMVVNHSVPVIERENLKVVEVLSYWRCLT